MASLPAPAAGGAPAHPGLWLVEFPNGSVGLYGRNRLPNQIPGMKRAWVGSSPGDITSNIQRLIGSWNLDVSTLPVFTSERDVQKVVQTPEGIAGDWKAPGGGGPGMFRPPTATPVPTAPGAKYPTSPAPFGLDFSAITDFLNYAAWILHPLNWLRMVEFMVGLILGGIGIGLLARRGGGGGITRRVVSLTPAGRTIRRIEGTRMGRHEGQREAARMRARQEETREVRRESAIERERINLDARRTARENK